jgi:hypothetical protein
MRWPWQKLKPPEHRFTWRWLIQPGQDFATNDCECHGRAFEIELSELVRLANLPGIGNIYSGPFVEREWDDRPTPSVSHPRMLKPSEPWPPPRPPRTLNTDQRPERPADLPPPGRPNPANGIPRPVFETRRGFH